MGNDQREAADELQALTHHVLQADIIGLRIVGVERQDGAGQLIHNVGAGRTEDHIFCETIRQAHVLGHNIFKKSQLLAGGEIAKKQQEADLSKTKAALAGKALDQVLHFVAAVSE